MPTKEDKSPNRSDFPPPIRAGEVYRLDDFRRRVGMARDALRAAEKKGLKVHRFGKRGYVFADDWLALLKSSDPS